MRSYQLFQREAAPADRRKSRRITAQYDVRLLLSADVLDADMAASRVMPLLLRGYTRDLCDSGFALVVPAVSMDERACVQKYPLRVTLPRGSSHRPFDSHVDSPAKG